MADPTPLVINRAELVELLTTIARENLLPAIEAQVIDRLTDKFRGDVAHRATETARMVAAEVARDAVARMIRAEVDVKLAEALDG